MTEQIEVFGQFDVRRNDDTTESKSGLTDQMSIDKARITNTFGGDQLNAALDAVNNKKTYVRGMRIKLKSFISVEKTVQ